MSLEREQESHRPPRIRGGCGRSSPGGRDSSARTSPTRCSRAATRCTSSTISRRANARTSPDGAELHVADIRDPDAIFDAVPPEAVFHLAAQADVRTSVERPDHDADVNVLGTVRILEAARRHGAKVVFASTGGAIYGECDGPAPEYGRAPPARAVRHLEALRRGVPRDVEPPLRHDPRRAPLRQRLRAAPGAARRGGRRRDLHGPAPRRRDADDLRRRAPDARLRLRRRRRARARSRGLDAAAACSTSAPASRRPCSSSSPGSAQRAASSGRPRFAPARLGELQRSVLDPSLAARELGWRPELTLADGLADTWAWVTAAA